MFEVVSIDKFEVVYIEDKFEVVSIDNKFEVFSMDDKFEVVTIDDKIIWLLIIITTTIACCCVYVDLSELYYNQRIQTTVEDSVHPLFMVAFPSIGLCLPYRIDWQRLQNEAVKEFLPSNATAETIQTFYAFFEILGFLKFSDLGRLKSLFTRNSNVNLTLIDNLNIIDVMKYLTFSCNDAFTGDCLWRNKRYNCCDLFTLERTELGYCYTFNSLVNPRDKARAEKSSFYPYHNSKAGEGTGLMARMVIDETRISPNFTQVLGVHIMIKKSEQWHADAKYANHNTYTKVAISTQITETTDRIKIIKPDDESSSNKHMKIPGLRYWMGNCRVRCHQECVLKYCKCNLDLFFPISEAGMFELQI
ncbi:pickpocket protein 19-like [Musca domestica]|uniref:Pickpocket protein 19-like n=1 Tax=Musca domestica TaxID=7370 RepID=A0ABM3V358_MUSDO|nr:pickpocket protein 19-like [Musca domestica]